MDHLKHTLTAMDSLIRNDRFERLLRQLWIDVDCGLDCGDCPHLNITPDQYATGDSPTDYECTAMHHTECKRLFEDECEAGRIAKGIYEL